MNKLLIVFISLLIVVSCRSTKKITQSDTTIAKQTEVVKTSETKENVKDNRDKVITRKTTTTKTKYYPPVKNSEPSKDSPVTEVKAEPVLIVESVETTVIEEKETDQGIVESKVEQKQSEEAKVNEESETETKIKEVKKPIIKAWMIYLGVIGVICALLFAFRKSPIIGKILNSIKNFRK